MRILTIVGARPQFVKAAVISRAIVEYNATGRGPMVEELIVHTGQHHDANMSQVFFDELQIPKPSFNLEIAGGTHGVMTGRMLAAIESCISETSPTIVLVYGDTNSTLAGALAAAKLHVPVAHVEAGLRSFNRRMPEEVNRVLTDHVSELLFCPTETAVTNLAREGITAGVHKSGDVMFDASLYYRGRAEEADVLGRLGLAAKNYCLATIHRAENTDDPLRLRAIFSALSQIASRIPVILPLHPRTRASAARAGIDALPDNLQLIDPVSFLEMIALEANANVILTDSGGVQKEAYFFKVPCITLRDETEWVETVQAGWNRTVGADAEAIVTQFEAIETPAGHAPLYGDGQAGHAVLESLLGWTECAA